MANNLPARLARNYLGKVTTRANLQEQRANQLTSDKIHLELSLQAALAKIRELEHCLKIATETIEQLTKRKRKAS